MIPPRCDVCGQRAVYHETRFDAGIALQQHFCATHGEPTWHNELVRAGRACHANAADLEQLRKLAAKRNMPWWR